MYFSLSLLSSPILDAQFRRVVGPGLAICPRCLRVLTLHQYNEWSGREYNVIYSLAASLFTSGLR